MRHTREELKQLQSKTLEEKIQISTARIIEWYERWNGQVYVSNSGGVDSTVLSHLVHRIYPDVVDVYCDTGLEYPELRKFILCKPNVIILKPSIYNRKTRKYEPISFDEVVRKYGYPIISKEQSGYIQEYNSANSEKTKHKLLNSSYSISKKWRRFIDQTCDIYVSDKCCNIMKKNPAKRFERDSGLHPYIGMMAEESKLRAADWIQFGCNAFGKSRPTSSPLSFWTKSDIIEYIYKHNVPYCSVYGDIVCVNGKYTTTGCKRTGCIFCGFGCHLEKEPNRFQSLAVTHPQLYDYCMRGGKYSEDGKWIPDKGLGMAKVLDFIDVKWWNDGDEAKRDKFREEYTLLENAK